MFRIARPAAAAVALITSVGVTGVAPAGAAPGSLGSSTPQITALWLADAETDTLIAKIEDGSNFDTDSLPDALTVVAEANGATGSVRFGNATIISTHIENLAPYALNGDNAGDLAAADLAIGFNVVRAMPFGGDGATGTAGKEWLVSFSLRPSTYVVDTTADGHDAAPGDGVCTTKSGPTDFASRSASSDGIDSPRTASVQSPKVAVGRGCTLRAALEETNAQPGHQRVKVPNGTDAYQVDLGVLEITDTVRVEGVHLGGGATWPAPVVDAGGQSGVFSIVDAGAVTLSWLRITGGADDGSGWRGGGVFMSGSSLELHDLEVVGNQANIGGGIYAQLGLVALEGTVVANNAAGHPDNPSGGGLTQRGGGIALIEAGAVIQRSTIEDNAAVRGGGLYLSKSSMLMRNTGVVNNAANTKGGGMEMVADSSALVAFTTIAGNQSGLSGLDGDAQRVGGGVAIDGSRLDLANSILAGNLGHFSPGDLYHSPDCYTSGGGEIISYRGNVI
ncbi:MAG: hypothetical protein R2710_28825, partial [Acidimicrobiales bacterium]